jgi:hypothetical protein
MKNLLLAIAGCITLSLSSCATLPENNFPFIAYVEPASYLACNLVLNNAVSEEDRVEKAKVIYALSFTIKTLSSGEVVLPEEFEEIVKLWTDDEKPHWVNLASVLTSLYKDAYVSFGDEPKKILSILEKIAVGCESAALVYIQPTDEETADILLQRAIVASQKLKDYAP